MAECYANAEKGRYFALTEKGYEKTPDRVKPEREAGKPLKGFEYRVPASWVKKGYVKESGGRKARE